MVEVGEPMPGPAEFVLWYTMGLGRVTGGLASRGGAAALAEVLEGRKELGTSLTELALRCRGCESESLSRREWRGLEGSEVGPSREGEVFKGSSVSSTTSGACFTLLCLSSSRSSFRAVFIVASMSCELCSTWAMTSGSSGRWLLKLLERPAVAALRNCGLSTLVLREEWRVMELRPPWVLTGRFSGPSFGRLPTGMEVALGLAMAPGGPSPGPWPSLGRKVLLMLADSGRFLSLLRFAR